MRRWLALIGGVLLLCSHGVRLFSMVLTNAGMLLLFDELTSQADFTPNIYPVYGVLENSPTTAWMMCSLRRAASLDKDRLSARRSLGHAAMAVGDATMAVDALQALVGMVNRNPLLYQGVVTAFSYNEQYDDVIVLYKSVPPLERTQVISDAVALAHLEQGSNEALTEAAALRPNDLYVNYHLWRKARVVGDVDVMLAYSEKLSYFPIEAVNPTDERLLNYVAQVVPYLLTEDIWGRDQTLNVVSYLVWKHSAATGVERLLQKLVEQYPTEPAWVFYLAELYHRRGDMDMAEIFYRQVLIVNSKYVQAYLRLGMLTEAKCELLDTSCGGLESAAGWYEKYYELAPNDLLGLRKLIEVYEVLGRSGAAVLREDLGDKTDEQRIVAEMLGVPIENVALGPNLVEYGGFEEWEDANPVGWRLWLYLGQYGDNRLYVAGDDNLVPEGDAARIITLWSRPPSEGFAEYIGESFSVTNTKYLVSVSYCSWYFVDGSGLFFLGEYDVRNGLRLAHNRLPDSNGQWSVARILVDGPMAPTSVTPLVRNWGVGNLWFQSVEISPVICTGNFCN